MTTFITSFAMMLFILLCENLIYEQNKKVKIILSDDDFESETSTCISILTRLGFFDSLPRDIRFEPFKPKRPKYIIGSNPQILELTKIKKQRKSLEIIELAEKAIIKNTNYDESQVSDICIMISEIVQNIFIHSEFKRPALIAIQRYPKINIVQLAIADSGIGIPETLRRTKKYKSIIGDSNLIFQAMRQRVSQFQDNEDRGEGLVRCRNIARKHGACLYIRSNNGFYYIDYSKIRFYGAETNFLSGTQIYINFPMTAD